MWVLEVKIIHFLEQEHLKTDIEWALGLLNDATEAVINIFYKKETCLILPEKNYTTYNTEYNTAPPNHRKKRQCLCMYKCKHVPTKKIFQHKQWELKLGQTSTRAEQVLLGNGNVCEHTHTHTQERNTADGTAWVFRHKLGKKDAKCWASCCRDDLFQWFIPVKALYLSICTQTVKWFSQLCDTDLYIWMLIYLLRSFCNAVSHNAFPS